MLAGLAPRRKRRRLCKNGCNRIEITTCRNALRGLREDRYKAGEIQPSRHRLTAEFPVTEDWMLIDWPALRAAATAAAARAYAPYSRLHVGAAGQAADGRIVTGCNVENASFGLTLCAECGLVSALHATGGGRLTGVSVVAGDGEPLVPCGRCRQLLLEAGGPDLLVDGGPEAGAAPRRLAGLLPDAFSGTDLAGRRDQREDQPGGQPEGQHA
jgi:cytidine deaminase